MPLVFVFYYFISFVHLYIRAFVLSLVLAFRSLFDVVTPKGPSFRDQLLYSIAM